MRRIIALILRAVALAMALGVALLCQTKSVTYGTALTMLSIGLACLALSSLEQFNRK